MAAKQTVSFNTSPYDIKLEILSKWLSCNGELWGVGPTAVFASAAALFLYNELEATFIDPGDHVNVSVMEKSLVSTMVIGMLALMIHLWVCAMRFFQYYLDTLIRDSPGMLLEMTTASLFGSKTDLCAFGPLTRFIRQQQPQIHITACWFLSLCYADYVRKNYCQRFNLPYLEQWQAELHDQVANGARHAAQKVTNCVANVHQRLRTIGQALQSSNDALTESPASKSPTVPFNKRIKNFDVIGPQKKKETREVRIISQASESTVEAIEQLRSYIAENCPCRSVQDARSIPKLGCEEGSHV